MNIGISILTIIIFLAQISDVNPITAAPQAAAAEASAEDRIIGATFKTLAKGFVAVVDLKEIKKTNLDKINRIDEDKFQREYARAYIVLKDLPQGFKARYKISKKMSRPEAINQIQRLDKKKIYELIDAMPDTTIAGQFRLYLSRHAPTARGLKEEINKIWDKIKKKIQGEGNVRAQKNKF